MLITAIYTLGFLMTQAMGAGLLLQAFQALITTWEWWW